MILDVLPPGWVRVRLGDICSQALKIHPTKLGRDSFLYIDIGSVDSSSFSVMSPALTQVEAAPSRARQVIHIGDTLFSTVRPYLKKVAYVGPELDGEIASTGFCVIRPVVDIDSRFIFHLTTSDWFINLVTEQQYGASYPAVRDEHILNIEIPLPPLAEQRRIVAALEGFLFRLEAGLKATERVATLSGKLMSAALRGAMTNHIETSGWETMTVGQMAKVSTGATPRRTRIDYYQDGTIPWVTSTLLNSPYIHTADKMITELALEETSVKLFPPGTLLLAMYGEGQTRGRCAELRISATTNQACAAIQLHPEYEYCRPWVKLVLEASYQQTRDLAAGGVQPNLSLGLVRGIHIPVPPREVQREILEDVSELRDAEARLNDIVKFLRSQGRELRAQILQSAFEGRLAPQNREDEAASVLLERIRTADQESNECGVREGHGTEGDQI